MHLNAHCLDLLGEGRGYVRSSSVETLDFAQLNTGWRP